MYFSVLTKIETVKYFVLSGLDYVLYMQYTSGSTQSSAFIDSFSFLFLRLSRETTAQKMEKWKITDVNNSFYIILHTTSNLFHINMVNALLCHFFYP